MTHRIRLRGPWSATEVEPGRVRFARRFGRPTNLDAGETVWLVGTAGPGSAHLNGDLLGMLVPDEPFAFDVTAVVKLRNELWLDVRGPAEPPADVALEVRRA